MLPNRSLMGDSRGVDAAEQEAPVDCGRSMPRAETLKVSIGSTASMTPMSR
jgi:hypothetical protein